MADIGAQLREARTRARIEIAQMEAQSKIRAKYLRALENEEWELLPGPTYVKSFLRTYGDMLDLDGRALVADYKREHEPFLDDDIGPTPKHTGGRMNRNQRNQRTSSRRFALIAVIIVLLAGGGYWFATRDSDSGTDAPAVTSADSTTPADGASDPADTAEEPAVADPVTVTLTAKASVFVCAKAGNRQLIDGRTYQKGQKTEGLRGRSIAVTLTNRNVDLRIDGKVRAIPAGGAPVNLTITADGVKRADAAATACKS